MNLTTKEIIVGAVSIMVASASGWAVTSTIANSSDIATIKATNELQTKNHDERYQRIEDSLRRIEDRLERRP